MSSGTIYRRVRGLVGTAITWAGAWALIGLGVGAAFWISGSSIFSTRGPFWLLVWAEVGAVNGAISGGVFALAVMVSERRRQIGAIGAVRFGILAAVTTGIVMAFSGGPLLGAICAAVGFLTGSGSAIVARRALPPLQAQEGSLPPAA